jgi:folate-binding Fe-S cluster repair protein YgfZ
MSEIHLPDPTSWSGALQVSDLGVIQAQGDEAAAFLHGQLSQDVNSQTATQARLAAYCSVKGRMLGSLLNLRPQPDLLWLLADRETVPALVKRLSMFVLRAKAKLTDASDSVSVLGVVGVAAGTTLGAALDTAPWSVQPVAGGQLARLPDVLGVPRWLWVAMPRPRKPASPSCPPCPPNNGGGWT